MSKPTQPLRHFAEIGDGFYHLRGTFRVGWIFDISTHMALARLSNGRYLILDTVKLSDEEKSEIDALTDHGNMVEAVLGKGPSSFCRDVFKIRD
jgi:hypothetical protein